MNLHQLDFSAQDNAPKVWERWVSLFGRLIILFAVIYCPMVFFTWTWRHYHVPKQASFIYLTLMLLVCWAVIAVRWRFVRSALATPAAFFFMVVAVTALWAVNLAENWETMSFLAANMVFMVLVAKFFTRNRDFALLAFLIGASCLVVDIYALAQWYDWQGWATDPDYFCFLRKLTPKPVSFMGNENFVAEYMNTVLPVCFAMMLCYRRRPAQLIFFSLVSLLNAITMVYIDCNASFAGFTVAIPIAAIILFYFKAIPFIHRIGLFNLSRNELETTFRKILTLMILGLSVLVVVGSIVPNKVRAKVASMANWMDSDGDLIPDGVAPIVFRLQCMDAASRNIIDSPFTGIGAGNFKVEHPLYESQLERKVLGEETLAREVHNDHLTFAVEEGVFGSFGWYWIVAASMLAIFRSLRLLEYQSLAAASASSANSLYKGIILPPRVREFYFYLQWGILTGLIAAMVSCMFDQTFVIVSSAILFWFLCGVSVAVYQRLYFASRGIRSTRLGVTPETGNLIQRQSRRIPGFVWIGIFFLFLLPVGVLNTYQLIGETWLRHGMTEEDDKNYYGMFQCFRKAMQIYPYQMESFYILGRYYIDAVVNVETAAMTNKAGGNAQLYPGLRYEDRRRLNEEGIVILQTDLFMNPNYKWAHNNLGVLYDRYYDLIKSGNDGVGSLFNIPPEPEHAENVLAASNLTYQRVLTIDPEQVFAHFNLGLSALKMGNYEQAIDELNAALISDPTRYDIYKQLAHCYIQIKNYSRAYRAAVKYLEKSILVQAKKSLEGNQNLAKYQQILQNLRDNDYEKAVVAARLLFQYNDQEAYNLFVNISGESIKNQQNPDVELTLKSVGLAEKIAVNPSADSYLWQAKVYEKIKRYDKSAQSVEEYLRLKPEDDEIRNTLMMLYVQMNDIVHAHKVMTVLVQRQPDNWKYLITYARLMAGLNNTWDQIFPYIQRAIQFGGDEARKAAIAEQPGNLILEYVKKDPRMRDLLGPSFYPAGNDSILPTNPESLNQGTPAQPPTETQTQPDAGTPPAQPADATASQPAGAARPATP